MALSKDYRVIRQIGQGSDGSVYLVLHIPTEQFRAAKQIHIEYAGNRRNELKMMRGLRHPALPLIYDVLEVSGQIWLIMEYIHGRALSMFRKEEITEAFFWDMAEQLSDVLAYLHSRASPILHLDIKPSNIIMKKDGKMILFDFGAAVSCGPREHTKALFATAGYAPPEQIARSYVDTRADIYAYGATLAFMLFGQVPEDLPLWENAQIKKENVRWRRLGMELIRLCTQNEKEKRLPNGGALCSAVRKIQNHRKYGKKIPLIILSGMLTVCGVVWLPSVIQKYQLPKQEKKQKDQYEHLLDSAGGFGDEKAMSYYHQAALLKPEDARWRTELLSRINADYRFTSAEEEYLTSMIYEVLPQSGETILDQIKKEPSEYADFACQLGLSYWYYYKDGGGKAAAALWFEQAVSCSNKNVEQKCMNLAQIHQKISGYQEKLLNGNQNYINAKEYAVYWTDLCKLWHQEDREGLSLVIQEQIAEEMVSCLLLYTVQLREAGTDQEQILKLLSELEMFVIDDRLQKKGELLKKVGAAAEAVERAYSAKE